jgi:dihydropteroate synthase
MKPVSDLYLKNGALQLNDRTHIMGIVNVTPDSFYDGGKYAETAAAVAQGKKLAEEGADLLDIGGESTRPGSIPVPVQEELARVLPVLHELRQAVGIPISIDTSKAKVAEAALDAGADIINDVSGLQFDPEMKTVAAKYRCPVIIMHIKGTPQTMQNMPYYNDVISEICDYFEQRVKEIVGWGIAPEQLLIDPGIGFGKRLQDNLIILKNMASFADLGFPLVVGPSRKGFIGTILELPVEERMEGTAAAVSAAILNGAHIIRVHDVKAMVRVARICDAVKRADKAERVVSS